MTESDGWETVYCSAPLDKREYWQLAQESWEQNFKSYSERSGYQALALSFDWMRWQG